MESQQAQLEAELGTAQPQLVKLIFIKVQELAPALSRVGLALQCRQVRLISPLNL